MVRQKLTDEPLVGTDVTLRFGEPEYGWLSFALLSGHNRVEWSLSDAFDPFRVDELDGGATEHTFRPWLERLAIGQLPALVLDQEGPFGVVLVAPLDDELIRVSAVQSAQHDGPALDIAIDRAAFVRSFYRQLVAFWESEVFRTQWSHWAECGDPQWSIRSELIEETIG